MTDRDAVLLAARPVVDADPARAATPLEAFVHETLRPVLKLQNELVLQVVVAELRKRTPRFADAAVDDRVVHLERLLGGDSRLKRTLVGVAMGALTAPELAFWLRHESEVRRRTVALLVQRVASQAAEVAARVGAS